jgi:hypothetical protein
MAKPNSIRENFNIKKHIKKQIILTCPHNGRENPFGVPPRDGSGLSEDCHEPFETKADRFTSKLTEYIASYIRELSKKDVYIEIGTIHRRYCDLNRSKVCAFEDLRVKHFYDKYHNSILTKINEMHSNIKKKGSFSFHFDIHGMRRPNKAGCELLVGTDNTHSITKLLERNPNALFDKNKNGLIKLLIENGIPTCPSKKGDPEDRNFDGGETIKRYGSSGRIVNGLNQSIQLEFALKLRNTDENRKKTAKKIAHCIVKFCDEYI